MKARTATMAGSVVSGLLASACCIGPLVLTFLGISGAAAARRFEPYRPFLLAVTFTLLAAAFYLTYRRAPVVCGPGEACEPTSSAGHLSKLMLWVATVVVILFAAFPWYSEYLF